MSDLAATAPRPLYYIVHAADGNGPRCPYFTDERLLSGEYNSTMRSFLNGGITVSPCNCGCFVPGKIHPTQMAARHLSAWVRCDLWPGDEGWADGVEPWPMPRRRLR